MLKRAGFTLIEIMLVLTIVMGLMTMELRRKSQEITDFQAAAAGKHAKTVADAVNAYLVNNYGPLMNGTDPNCLPAGVWPCYMNPSALVAQQLLPASFSMTNPWGSEYSVAVTRVGASPYYNLNAMVVTSNPWSGDNGVNPG